MKHDIKMQILMKASNLLYELAIYENLQKYLIKKSDKNTSYYIFDVYKYNSEELIKSQFPHKKFDFLESRYPDIYSVNLFIIALIEKSEFIDTSDFLIINSIYSNFQEKNKW